MQRLFPAEGETTPRWRFPEFRDAGEWGFRSLGAMTTKIGSGVTPRGGDKNYLSAGIPFVRSQNVGWGTLLLNDIVFISGFSKPEAVVKIRASNGRICSFSSDCAYAGAVRTSESVA